MGRSTSSRYPVCSRGRFLYAGHNFRRDSSPSSLTRSLARVPSLAQAQARDHTHATPAGRRCRARTSDCIAKSAQTMICARSVLWADGSPLRIQYRTPRRSFARAATPWQHRFPCPTAYRLQRSGARRIRDAGRTRWLVRLLLRRQHPTPAFTALVSAILTHLDPGNTGSFSPENLSRLTEDLGYPAHENLCTCPPLRCAPRGERKQHLQGSPSHPTTSLQPTRRCSTASPRSRSNT
jgi:hypothetical protein